jgi:hypothetical protein
MEGGGIFFAVAFACGRLLRNHFPSAGEGVRGLTFGLTVSSATSNQPRKFGYSAGITKELSGGGMGWGVLIFWLTSPPGFLTSPPGFVSHSWRRGGEQRFPSGCFDFDYVLIGGVILCGRSRSAVQGEQPGRCWRGMIRDLPQGSGVLCRSAPGFDHRRLAGAWLRRSKGVFTAVAAR